MVYIMVVRSYIDDERLSYFEDWLKDKGVQEDKEKVVDEKSAVDFISKVFRDDTSLERLAKHEDSLGRPYAKLVDGNYIENLIQSNLRRGVAEAQESVERQLVLLERRRIALQELLPKRQAVTRRKVITLVMTNRVLNRYGFSKTVSKSGRSQYRDAKTGRFVSNKELLGLADKVIAASASKRRAVEKVIRQDFLGREKR